MTLPPNAPTLRVLSGLHAGASLPLGPGSHRIGGGPEADVLLCDDGVAPLHAEVEVEGDAVRLRALHAGLSLPADPSPPEGASAGGASLPPGAPPRVLTLPAEFDLGPVRLRCDAASDAAEPALQAAPPPPARSRRLWPLAAGTALAAAVLLLPPSPLEAFTFALGPSAPGRSFATADASAAPVRPAAPPLAPDAPPAASAEAPAPAAGPAPIPADPPLALPPSAPILAAPDAGSSGPEAPTAVAALRAELAAAGLHGVALRADGAVVTASGEVTPEALQAWRLMQQSFDRRAGGGHVLVNQVRVKADRPLAFAIDSVWTGRSPNLVLAGQKYFIGATLPDGSTLEAIEAGRILVRRGERRVAVAY